MKKKIKNLKIKRLKITTTAILWNEKQKGEKLQLIKRQETEFVLLCLDLWF